MCRCRGAGGAGGARSQTLPCHGDDVTGPMRCLSGRKVPRSRGAGGVGIGSYATSTSMSMSCHVMSCHVMSCQLGWVGLSWKRSRLSWTCDMAWMQAATVTLQGRTRDGTLCCIGRYWAVCNPRRRAGRGRTGGSMWWPAALSSARHLDGDVGMRGYRDQRRCRVESRAVGIQRV
jgi:hypothetical protein